MPAGYAHYVFGEMVYQQLSPSTQQIINQYKDLYHIGIHGPDILFYHQPFSSNPVRDLGYSMHGEEAYDYFFKWKKLIHDKASLVYILGFINHFILDSECHGYIGQMEKKLQMTHSEIESEFDRQLLIDQGKDPLRTSLTTHIHPTLENAKIIAPFFGVTEKDIYKSLKDLKLYLGILVAPHRLKRNIILWFMKKAGVYDSMSKLMINYEKNPKSELCVSTLIKKMDNAVEIAAQEIEDYMTHLDDEILSERFIYNYE